MTTKIIGTTELHSPENPKLFNLIYSQLCSENSQILAEFMKHCERKDLSKDRKEKYIRLFKILDNLKINLKTLKEKDIDKFFFWLKSQDYADWTKVTFWKMFKHLCRWLKVKIPLDEYKFKIPECNPEILTQREIAKLIASCKNFKHRLIIMLLYESGMRAGELLNLKKSDVIFDDNGAIIKVNGKTGVRPIRIVRCAKYLKAYYDFCDSDKLFPFTHRALNKIIKTIAKRAGIKKKVYPHLFRHTRATHLAQYLTEPEMRLFFGWSRHSKMPSVYVHLSGRDIDQKIIELNKIAKEVVVR
jgi:integrase